KDVATTDIPRESISEKIVELELRLREDKRNEIVEKILQKNAMTLQTLKSRAGFLSGMPCRRFLPDENYRTTITGGWRRC
ncbi:hypothetical protein ACM911_004118, partial [Cronobacter dublinensis]